MPRAKDDGTAQGNYGAAWLVDASPGQSHHPLRAAISAISNKAYWLKQTKNKTKKVHADFLELQTKLKLIKKMLWRMR